MTEPIRRTNINVKFKNGTNKRDVRDSLREIRSIKGVFNAEALFPGETDKVLKYLYIARTDGTVAPEEVREAISKVKDVEYAEFPAVRRPLNDGPDTP